MSEDRATIEARAAVTFLRDFAREHGMDHRHRDPMVMAIHRALDSITKERDALREATENLLFAIDCWRKGGITAEGCRQAEDRARLTLTPPSSGEAE